MAMLWYVTCGQEHRYQFCRYNHEHSFGCQIMSVVRVETE